MIIPEPGNKRGRVHDAEGARQAILDAAEEIFAQRGFAGARVDAIAARAGYNKSLLFQYFGDKLNLYAEVLKRADKEANELQARTLAPLFTDETILTNANQFRAFLESMVRIVFDYLNEHPRLARILLWEMAEGWQTYAKISSQFQKEEIDQFKLLIIKAQKARLLRSDFSPLIQLTFATPVCQAYLAYLHLYQMVLPGEDFSSPAALERAREYLVNLVVAGTLVNSPKPRSMKRNDEGVFHPN